MSNEDFLGAVENNTDSGENVASLEQKEDPCDAFIDGDKGNL